MTKFLVAAIAAIFVTPVWAQNAVPVTVQNFPRAESDLYMSKALKDGGFGKFIHNQRSTTAPPSGRQRLVNTNPDSSKLRPAVPRSRRSLRSGELGLKNGPSD